MTSFRQIEANRRNALRSTGPASEEGKRRSRRNAIRHGLTAETVLETIEDIEDYRGFEAAVIADYDARTAVERELVLRLASLLWRLRRATAIETELLRIQAEISLDFKMRRKSGWPRDSASPMFVSQPSGRDGCCDQQVTDSYKPASDISEPIRPGSAARDLAHCFIRLAHIDDGVFERLGRYESALSRQVFRILLLLRSARMR